MKVVVEGESSLAQPTNGEPSTGEMRPLNGAESIQPPKPCAAAKSKAMVVNNAIGDGQEQSKVQVNCSKATKSIKLKQLMDKDDWEVVVNGIEEGVLGFDMHLAST